MPIGPLLGMLIGTAVNTGATVATNYFNRRANERQYQQQRRDAIADRTFENFYNSPAEVMKRFEDAGLNKNLIYGQGNNSASTRNTNMAPPSIDTPNIPPSLVKDGLLAAVDLKLKTAQTNNLNENIEVIRQEAAAKALDVAGKQTQNEQGRLNLKLAQENFQTAIDQKKATLRKTDADTTYTIDQNERQALLTGQTLQKGVQEILNMRAQRGLIQAQTLDTQSSNALKKLDIALREKGIMPNDPLYARIAGRAIDYLQTPEMKKKFQELKTDIQVELPSIIQALRQAILHF